MWADSIQDLKVGSMIATLAQDDPLGHPFWITKVIEIQKSMQGQVANSIVVQWFRTTHTNPLKGKYAPKIVVCKKTKRAKRTLKTNHNWMFLILEK